MSEEKQRDSLREAAEKAGVSFPEFKEWMLVHANITPQRWSKWTHGVEPIPDRYIIEFLREKLDRMTSNGSLAPPSETEPPGETPALRGRATGSMNRPKAAGE
jgi:hypothetical protein